MRRLFISYRWDDEAGTVKRIVECLQELLPQWQIFFDQESISLGQSFPDQYRRAVSEADVVFVMIGPKWLSHLLDRRDEAIDHVRSEVELSDGS